MTLTTGPDPDPLPREYQSCKPCAPPSTDVLKRRILDLKSKTPDSKRIAISVKTHHADAMVAALDAAQGADVYVHAYVFEDPEAALRYHTSRPFSLIQSLPSGIIPRAHFRIAA